MLADIGEGFLHNAVDGNLGRQGKQGVDVGFLEAVFDLIMFAKFLMR